MSKMPKEIWLNNAEFKLCDALRQKGSCAIGSTKYHHDDTVQILVKALELYARKGEDHGAWAEQALEHVTETPKT